MYVNILASKRLSALWHEFNHEAIQTTPSEAIEATWIQEAIIEELHQESAELHNDTPPDLEATAQKFETYRSERYLLDDFVGDHYRDAVYAYAGDEKDRGRFYAAMDKRWGVSNALFKLNIHIDALEREIAESTPSLPQHEVVDQAIARARDNLAHNNHLVFGHGTYAAPRQNSMV